MKLIDRKWMKFVQLILFPFWFKASYQFLWNSKFSIATLRFHAWMFVLSESIWSTRCIVGQCDVGIWHLRARRTRHWLYLSVIAISVSSLLDIVVCIFHCNLSCRFDVLVAGGSVLAASCRPHAFRFALFHWNSQISLLQSPHSAQFSILN